MKFHLYIFYSIFFSCINFGLISAQEVPKKIQVSTKLINGTSLSSEGTGIVRIEIISAFSENTCTGVVIAPDSVLTARHCFEEDPIDVGIYFNSTTDEDDGVGYYKIFKMSSVPLKYTNGVLNDDLIIIKTDDDLPPPYIPIFSKAKISKGMKAQVMGFGLTESGTYGNFKSGSIRINKVSKTSIFSKYTNVKSVNPCFGDSGGPLLIKQSLSKGRSQLLGVIGIVSAGTSTKCSLGDQNSYVNLQDKKARDFIKKYAPLSVFK